MLIRESFVHSMYVKISAKTYVATNRSNSNNFSMILGEQVSTNKLLYHKISDYFSVLLLYPVCLSFIYYSQRFSTCVIERKKPIHLVLGY